MLQYCIDTEKGKTYHDLLKTDFLKTMDDLLLIFDIGRIEAGSTKHKEIVDKFGLLTSGVELHAIDIYKKDEINGLFNAYFGTNVDLLSLPDIYDGGYYCRTAICGDYFIYYENNNGYINYDTDAQWGCGYRYGAADYWKWQMKDLVYGTLSDYIYTITVTENMYGYEFPAIKYISFLPPSNELFESYGADNADKIRVMLNDNELYFDQPPIIYNDRTLVPLRAIFEALGAEVTWDGETQTVTAVRGKTTIKLTIDKDKIYINNSAKDIDVPAKLIDDTTYIPLRVIAEAFNCDVKWNDETKTATIYTNNPTTTKPAVNSENIITGIESHDSYIKQSNRAKPLKTLVHDFDKDGTDEVIAFCGEIRDKQANRMYGDMVLYTFADEPKVQTVLSDGSIFLDDTDIINIEDGSDALYLAMGTPSMEVYLLYGFKDGTLEKEKCLGGEAEWTFNSETPWWYSENFLLAKEYYDSYWRAIEFESYNCDKYMQLDGGIVHEETEKPSYYTRYYDEIYRYSGIEVSPEFIKTLKNGTQLYKTLYEDAIKKGKKVQIIYRSNGCLHFNYREYDPTTGYILNTYRTFITSDDKKTDVVEYDKGFGTYVPVGSDWWDPEIILKPDSEAYKYQVDTSADFNNLSDFKITDSIADQLSSGMLTENLLNTKEIVKANQLLKNSWYDYMKTFTGVHKVFGQNLNITVPKIYDTLGNYRNQILKAVGVPTNYKSYYEVLLIDLLTYQDTPATDENAQKDVMLENICSIITDSVENNYKSAKDQKKLADNIMKMLGVETKDSDFKLMYGFCGDVLKLINTGKASVEEGEKLINTMIVFKSLTDGQISMLDSIKNHTEDNELKQACDAVKKAVQAAKNIDATTTLDKLKLSAYATENEFIKWAVDAQTDILIDEAEKALGKVGAVIAAAKAGKEVGMLIGNNIFAADKLSTDLLTIDALNSVDDAIITSMKESEKEYQQEMNYDNAIKLTAAADMYKILQIYACDIGVDLVETVRMNERNQSIAAPFIPWATFPTLLKRITGQMPDYQYLDETIRHIKGMLEIIDLYNNYGLDISEYIYTDKSTNASQWATPYIKKASDYGILLGYLQMGYTRALTRAEFCTYLVNLIESKSGKNIDEIILDKGTQLVSPFEDCQYYYVDCVYKLGIISGIDEKTFEPLGSLTREQAAKMLTQTAKVLGIKTDVNTDYNTSGASDWAIDGIKFVIDRGIMTGTDAGFEPKAGYSKEQALSSMVRFYENLQ